ncbi:MAG: hypothetical protein HZY76_03425 [Anaerolineae bacterium]|nr:MAG: hypothetical protein HZY76_03425 [Anaerolineae bacterium]
MVEPATQYIRPRGSSSANPPVGVREPGGTSTSIPEPSMALARITPLAVAAYRR